MLFNSTVFLYGFLPLVVAGFFVLGTRGHARAAMGWLVAASLFFYGWWNPPYLALLLGSVACNYALGRRLARGAGRAWLAAGVAGNLAAIGYAKYAGFFVAGLNTAFGLGLELGPIVLPLAISFFTFQQIAYLVDAHRGLAREDDWLRYALFVTFFPQLIAGPIVHHGDVIPQFRDRRVFRPSLDRIAVGSAIFTIGLAKKVLLADGIAPFATPVFEAAAAGHAAGMADAWAGALAYGLQIYFDFSGYSDMAIGLGCLFGIDLPLNFSSPYKATNVIDFWRRWHRTLSRFLRDYLYIPLGGNRHGRPRRYLNLMLTMLLGGLWHGASLTFVAWGGLHGLFLVLNHGWRRLAGPGRGSRAGSVASWALTFGAVTFAWVLFRADSLDAALGLWRAMVGMTPAEAGAFPAAATPRAWLWILGLGALATLAPSTQEITAPGRRPLEGPAPPPSGPWRVLAWRPTPAWALALAALAIACLANLDRAAEFLYYQF